MNARRLLLMAFLAVLSGAVVLAVMGSFALGVLTTFLAFALLVSIQPWLSKRLSGDDRRIEAEAKSVADEISRSSTAQAYNPDLDGRSPSASLSEEETVRHYSEAFDISTEKARSLYRSGYRRWGDLQEAIPEDLMTIPGINPTVAKRIIGTVRQKKAP